MAASKNTNSTNSVEDVQGRRRTTPVERKRRSKETKIERAVHEHGGGYVAQKTRISAVDSPEWGLALREASVAAAPSSDASLRSIFLRRISAWSQDLAEAAPPEVLAEALERPSARGSMLYVLGAVPSTEEQSETEAMRERAIQRALAEQEVLVREAGGMRTTQEVAERLGVTRQSVDRYRTGGKVLALSTPRGFVFPEAQFHERAIVPGLDQVLKAMQGMSFWEALSGLVTPTPTLEGRSVIEALKGSGPEDLHKIFEVVRAYASE